MALCESKIASKADLVDLCRAYNRMTEGHNIPVAVKAAELLG